MAWIHDVALGFCVVVREISDRSLEGRRYMPLLAKLLALFDGEAKDGEKRNLHVIVSHSPAIDGAIVEEGLEESASYAATTRRASPVRAREHFTRSSLAREATGRSTLGTRVSSKSSRLKSRGVEDVEVEQAAEVSAGSEP